MASGSLDPALHWIVEDAAGKILGEHHADEPIHPASTIKLATSAWALEQLGANHRFVTSFGVLGTVVDGRLEGDLLVRGGADPDFHVENAYLVARALNRAGIREVTGKLLVDHDFWIGWEGGSERREKDPELRATGMARRLRDALDPDRFAPGTRKAIEEFVQRRGLAASPAPRVVFAGGVGLRAGAETDWLVTHRSNPLAVILRRLNAYSNNDIERLEKTLGTAAELAARLAERWEVPGDRVSFETLSGLGANRLTPRLIVRLVRELREVCLREGLEIGDILPTAGCDPGTMKNYPRLEGELGGNLVAKTGTMTTTDGGVAVLAGLLRTGSGERLFCTVAPRSGKLLELARRFQERWLLDLVLRQGPPDSRECREAIAFSDAGAQVAVAPAMDTGEAPGVEGQLPGEPEAEGHDHEVGEGQNRRNLRQAQRPPERDVKQGSGEPQGNSQQQEQDRPQDQ